MNIHAFPFHRISRQALRIAPTLGLALIGTGPFVEAKAGATQPAFSLQQQNQTSWLVNPNGRRFFSLGVCCVGQGTAREKYHPEKPGYAAWRYYGSSNEWAGETLQRLSAWGFTTVGGWSDYAALKECHNAAVAFTPVLHMGSTAGAPWWDMWDPKIIARMEQVARDQILAVRDDPRLLGYPEVAQASAGHLDAASSNLNAGWNDGSFPRYYLDTLEALTRRPLFVSEFYLAARENRSGNENKPGHFPVADTPGERIAGFRRTIEPLLRLPYVVGADWFQ